MRTRTKIICTMGPAVSGVDKIIELTCAGMNVARINFSHGTMQEHKEVIANIKKAREIIKMPIAIMADTKGPEIRIGNLPQEKMDVVENMRLKLVNVAQKENEIPITPFTALATLTEGMTILFNDGYILTKVIKKDKDFIEVEVQNSGFIRSRNKVNIPDAYLNLPAMTEQDKEDLIFACDQDVDVIAASFIRSPEHILEIKNFLAKERKTNLPIIAKIENKEGIENFDYIVEIADGIMVARGDLGVEVDVSIVPQLQKMMIAKTTQRAKPVIIATQMLESMIYNPRPTRAEVSDVAGAIYDKASLVMLSAETALGKYPVAAVKQMKSVIAATEKDINYGAYFQKEATFGYSDVSSSVAIAAVKTTYSADAKALFVFTTSGFTARLVARFCPDKPIVVLTTKEKIYQQLAMIWGVIPHFTPKCNNSDEAFAIISQFAKEQELVAFGDLVVVTAGIPFGKKGSTNLMRIESIGAILARGMFGNGSQVQGHVAILLSQPTDVKTCQGKILVIPRCDDSYAEVIKVAKGVVLQNNIADVSSENYAISLAQTFNVALIVRADNAMTLLEDDMLVEMDPEKGLIYRKTSCCKG